MPWWCWLIVGVVLYGCAMGLFVVAHGDPKGPERGEW